MSQIVFDEKWVRPPKSSWVNLCIRENNAEWYAVFVTSDSQ